MMQLLTKASASDLQRDLIALADQLEPRFKASWRKTVRMWMRDPEITKALKKFSSGNLSPSEFITATGRSLSDIPVSLSEGIKVLVKNGYGSDVTGQWVSNYAQRRSADLTTTSHKAISVFVTNGINDGLTPQQISSRVSRVIATDQRFAVAALNMHNSMRELKPGKAAQIMDSYIDRAAARRAQVIARTETMSALNIGFIKSVQDQMMSGAVEGDAEFVWIAAPGCCAICTKLDGETASIVDAQWNGYSIPPIHPDCRCVVGVK